MVDQIFQSGAKVRLLLEHAKGVRCLFVKDHRLFSGGEDNKVVVWNKMTGQILARLEGHTGTVTSVFVDEGRIYTGSEDGTIRIWNLQVTYRLLPIINIDRLEF